MILFSLLFSLGLWEKHWKSDCEQHFHKLVYNIDHSLSAWLTRELRSEAHYERIDIFSIFISSSPSKVRISFIIICDMSFVVRVAVVSFVRIAPLTPSRWYHRRIYLFVSVSVRLKVISWKNKSHTTAKYNIYIFFVPFEMEIFNWTVFLIKTLISDGMK